MAMEEMATEISMHAISGSLSPHIIRVKGLIKYQPIFILIDLGSTHNVINLILTKRIQYRPMENSFFEVMVANEDKLATSG